MIHSSLSQHSKTRGKAHSVLFLQKDNELRTFMAGGKHLAHGDETRAKMRSVWPSQTDAERPMETVLFWYTSHSIFCQHSKSHGKCTAFCFHEKARSWLPSPRFVARTSYLALLRLSRASLCPEGRETRAKLHSILCSTAGAELPIGMAFVGVYEAQRLGTNM